MSRKNQRPKKRLLVACALIAATAVAVLFWSRAVVSRASEGTIVHDPAAVAKNKVALVLGCSPRNRAGETNLFFEYRMDAAGELWRSGKVDFLLVSGDNRRADYDEPTAMMHALIRRGVPARAIVRDFAGFRTLDSVLRTNRVFGETHFCIVSQEDHLKRAIYIARQHGLEVTGFAAREVPFRQGVRTDLREAVARLGAVIDVELLDRQPHHLGPRIQIGRVQPREP